MSVPDAESPSPTPLSEFPVRVPLPVQWGDQDALGHVNNTVPILWFETARVQWLLETGLTHMLAGTGIGPILAAVHCNYRRQIVWPDTVWVGTRIGRVGRTSMVMEHHIFSEAQQMVAADGESTVVFFDYARQRPVRLPKEVLAAIDHH